MSKTILRGEKAGGLSRGALLLCGIVALVLLGAVGIGAAGTNPADATVDADGPTVATDDTVTVTYTVTNNDGSPANLTLGTQTPDDWSISAKSTSSGSGTWHGEGNVSWTNIPGDETRTAEITYKADSASDTVYLFNATVLDSDTTTDDRVDDAAHPVVIPENAVWERSVLPLRADTDDAETVVDNQRIKINDESGSEETFTRDLAVFGTGTDATIEFKETDGADISQYKNEELQVIVGHAAKTPDTDDASVSMVPTSVAEAQGMFTAENLSRVNQNVDFKEKTMKLDGSGEDSFDLDTSKPGQYGIIVVEGEKLVNVEDGNISPAGPSNGTIVGVEGVAVQSDASKVTEPGKIEPGETADFDVKTGLSGNVSHTVVVYDEDTFTGSETVINLTASPSMDFTADDVQIEHGIKTLNGVVELDSDVSALGFAVPAQKEAGSILVADIVASAASETDGAEVETIATGDKVLNGSAVAVADVSGDSTVSVPTFGNWSEGEYRYVHVASEQDNTRAFETNKGTIKVKDSTTGGGDDPGDGDDGGAGGGGGYAPTPPGDGGSEGEVSFTDLQLSSASVEPGQSFQATVTVTNQGSSSVTRSLTLMADDVTVDSQSVTVAGGSSEEVTFEGSLGAEGTYDLSIDGTSLGSLEVARSTQPSGEADISVTNADVSDSVIDVGDSVTVTATVENVGDETGEKAVYLRVNGEMGDNRIVTLDAGETTEIEFTRTFEEAGSYELQVGDVDAGSVTVEAAEEDDGGDGGGGGGGIGGILLVFLLVVGVTISAVVGYLYYIGELENVINDIQQRFQ